MNKVFEQAKQIARDLGYTKRYVNADQVQAELEKLGLKSSDLGNAAGNVFRSREWKSTGRFVVSARPTSHKRQITVWEYTGTKPVAPKLAVDIETSTQPIQTLPFPILNPEVPAKLYVIKFKTPYGSGWSRSGNGSRILAPLGTHLSRISTNNLADARKEAQVQQSDMKGLRYEYAVFDAETDKIVPDLADQIFPVTQAVVLPKYVIQFRWSSIGDWQRSHNSTKTLTPSRSLALLQFENLAEAQKEAEAQAKIAGYEYAVFESGKLLTPVFIAGQKKYIIEFRENNAFPWQRSYNTSKTLGTPISLGKHQFDSLTAAEVEAVQQKSDMGYPFEYRAVAV